MASTIGGGEIWEKKIGELSNGSEAEKSEMRDQLMHFLGNHRERRAQANEDYEPRRTNVTFMVRQ